MRWKIKYKKFVNSNIDTCKIAIFGRQDDYKAKNTFDYSAKYILKNPQNKVL